MALNIVLATSSNSKVKEYKNLINCMKVININLIDLNTDGYDLPEENGSSYSQNALIKAEFYRDILLEQSWYKDNYDLDNPYIIISDDSGLEIDALNGAPGLYSHRYLGPTASREDQINHIMKEMEGIEERDAKIELAMCLLGGNNLEESMIVKGCCCGSITKELKNFDGYGYDPIFYVTEAQKLSSELTDEEKAFYGPRSKCFRYLIQHFLAYMMKERVHDYVNNSNKIIF